jgi:hydroxymethylpyrimidine pyrophosphatase-like HAD family hydrolase
MRIDKSTGLNSRKKLLCFDLDGTLSQHKSHLPEANKELLKKLDAKYKLIMVGAGNAPRIYNQMEHYPIDIIANYGMQESAMVDGEFKIIREDTSIPDKEYFNTTCQYLREKYGYTDYAGGHLEFHASGMVTFCLIGSGAKVEDKVVFDPDRSKRRVLYDEICTLFPEYSVYIGGSSSFDFAPKQYNKYDSIMKYASEHGYAAEEILFVGDDFGDGGGDSHVRIFGMDYVQIDDYKDLPQQLEFLL